MGVAAKQLWLSWATRSTTTTTQTTTTDESCLDKFVRYTFFFLVSKIVKIVSEERRSTELCNDTSCFSKLVAFVVLGS